jgi:hypothetical protein
LPQLASLASPWPPSEEGGRGNREAGQPTQNSAEPIKCIATVEILRDTPWVKELITSGQVDKVKDGMLKGSAAIASVLIICEGDTFTLPTQISKEAAIGNPGGNCCRDDGAWKSGGFADSTFRRRTAAFQRKPACRRHESGIR